MLYGNTEEGKSTLARALILAKPHVIFVDTKQSRLEEAQLATIGPFVYGEDYTNLGPGRFVWRPPIEYVDDMAMRERFFRWALENGNRVIFLDEIIDHAESATRFPRWLRLCVQRGRSNNLGIWGTTQQPRGIPTWFTAQAQFIFTFHVGLPEYRDRIDEVFEQDVPWSKITLKSHRFVWKDSSGMHGPYTLDMAALAEEEGLTAGSG